MPKDDNLEAAWNLRQPTDLGELTRWLDRVGNASDYRHLTVVVDDGWLKVFPTEPGQKVCRKRVQ